MTCGKPLFPLGRIVATPGAIDALTRANQYSHYFLDRHGGGDWGEINNENKAQNEYSLQHGLRILSSYITATGEKLWVTTEAGRSSSLLRPNDY